MSSGGKTIAIALLSLAIVGGAYWISTMLPDEAVVETPTTITDTNTVPPVATGDVDTASDAIVAEAEVEEELVETADDSDLLDVEAESFDDYSRLYVGTAF